MTQSTVEKKINRTAEEMQSLIERSKRKLLEFEVMLSMSEIMRGKFEIFDSADKIFRKIK